MTSRNVRKRYLLGGGAAACAVCCAAPVLGLVGIAGTGTLATVATFVYAGLVFALTVVGITAFAAWANIRRRRSAACSDAEVGPVPVELSRRRDT